MINLIPFSENLQIEKYRGPGETYSDMVNRWCGVLNEGEENRRTLKDIFINGLFCMAGRCQAAVGSAHKWTCFNCFMGDTIKDNLTGKGGIMWRCLESAQSMRLGGGVGHDFSTIRPADHEASGPVHFLPIFSAMCKALQRGGSGQGALMGMLRVEHPSIYEYVVCKHPPAETQVLYDLLPTVDAETQTKLLAAINKLMPLQGFNLSVYVTDEFMECVEHDTPFWLRFGGKKYEHINARGLWEMIMRSTWDYGDPGIFFGDTANKWDNLHYLPHRIIGTNPCGEQPFHKDNSCLLGSFNMVNYLYQNSDHQQYWIAYDRLKEDIPTVVRAMDKIIDLSHYPLKAQEVTAKKHRRMGLGVMGMANTIEAIGKVLHPEGHAYGGPLYLKAQDTVLKMICHESYRASVQLAKEKGPFPDFDRDKYLQGKFIQTLPDDIQEGIYKHGIRNSHLTSIAPTGTISLAYNNVSAGIEPTFSRKQQRIIRVDNTPQVVDLEDYGVAFLGTNPKTALECTVDEHLQVLLHAQKYVDSAVSKTINVPHATSWDDFKGVYWTAWKGGAKGCTTFTTGGKKLGIMKSLDMPSCTLNPETGEKSCD